MRRLKIKPRARLDARTIWSYIAEHNASAATRILQRIFDRFQLIRRSPESGEERADISHGARQAIVENYVIFYEFDDTAVSILRVIHGARDLPSAFHNP